MTSPEPGVVARTGRLTLRWMTPDDAPFLLELLNEPSFLENIGDRNVRTLDDARRYVAEGPAASYARHGHGLNLVTLGDGAAAGICGLLKRDALDDVDVGFAFLPAYWGQGLATESADAAIEHGRLAFGLGRVAGVVKPHNAASIRVLERLGMRYERAVQLVPDGPESLLYAKTL